MKSKKYIQAELRHARKKLNEKTTELNRSYRLAVHNNELIKMLCYILEGDAECCDNCIYSSGHDTSSCVCGLSKEIEPLCHCCNEFGKL